VRYVIYANDTLNNEGWVTGYYFFDEGVDVTINDPNDNEHVQLNADYTVEANITQITQGGSITIDHAQFRYQYDHPTIDGQYLWSDWIDLSLESGDTEEGIYIIDFEVNDTLWTEDESYKLQVKGENSNGQSDKETAHFVPDSTPESGLKLGTLHEPDEILCGNVTESVVFWCTATIHESQQTYTKTLRDSYKEALGDEFYLVTDVFVDSDNVTETEWEYENGNWELTIVFDEDASEDEEFRIYFYEEEPQISNAELDYTGRDTIDYSIDVLTERDWELQVHIGETWMPSSASAWWSQYTPEELTYTVFADEEQTSQLEANVTVVGTDRHDRYVIALDIVLTEGLTTDITQLYIHGEIVTTQAESSIDWGWLFLGAIPPIAGVVAYLLDDPMNLNLSKKLKMLILGSGFGVGIAIAVIPQFVTLPSSLSLAPMPLGVVSEFVGSANIINTVLLAVFPIMIAGMLVMLFRPKQTQLLQILSLGGLGTLMIVAGTITGTLSLSAMDTAMRATLNMSVYIGLGVTFALFLYMAKHFRGSMYG
jgi:hypothetical protein